MSLHFLRALRVVCFAGLAVFCISAIATNSVSELTFTLDPANAKSTGWATTDDGRLQVLVELSEPSAAVVYAQAIAGQSPKNPAVRRAAANATQSNAAKVLAQQSTVAKALAQMGAREIYRVGRAVNGIAVAIPPSQLAQLHTIPGVLRVLPIPAETPSLTTSVPFIGAPNLWGNTLGLPEAITGTGIRIGIIDTGIDYQHADFGGTGLLADYQANDTTVITDGFFPNAKVVGGTDLAGDAYTGGNTPAPDPDPMDCYGHGTHVAGIAAGYGVNSDGSTYSGSYDPSLPFSTLRIGPGVAPQASLYSIRIFGCSGSTGLTVQGIDWALDPNGDNDLSDHLDVINMSLGSSFGDPTNASAVASENAAATGMIVVAAAGNDGDTYFINGSPASSGRTISVAAIADPGSGAGAVLQINSPAPIAGGYAAAAAGFTPTPPAPSGQTAQIVQALDAANASGPLTTDGCTALTNAAAVAGNIALIDRGTCSFIVKVQNAQAAGAIVVDNVSGDPTLLIMSGSGTVTIPSVYISDNDGNTIKAQLAGGVNGTLGAATLADTLATFSSRGPRFGAAPTRLKPDISAPGLNIVSAQTGITCVTGGSCITPTATGFDAGSLNLTLSGTSMATPHMAGMMALLLELHPDWSVEQLKALAMNGALHDETIGANGSGLDYGAGRVGAGRVDASDSAVNTVVALNGDDTGLVSVSFETSEVVGTATEVKKVRLVNTGTTAATYDLGINTILTAPGVGFSLPDGNSVTLPAGGSTEIDVQMSANSALMTHAHDATIAPTQAAPAPLTSLGNLARHWLTEESGFLTLSQGGTTKLRLPLYIVTRSASSMSASNTIATGGAPTGSTTIPLSGTHVCTGTLAAGPTCTGTFPNDEQSLVTPLELQVVNPRNTSLPDYANIQYAGVAYDASTNLLYFGISTWGDWSTPNQVAFNVYIDNNSDGTYDRILFNSDPGSAALDLFGTSGATPQNSFLSLIFNLATNGVSIGTFVNRLSAASVDSVLYKTNVMFLAATPASLGLAAGTTAFKYKIQTCAGFQPLCQPVSGNHYDEATGPYSYNYAAASQGLNFNGGNLVADLNGGTIPVTWNTANMTANSSLGALLLHHHNTVGNRAQLVTLQGTPSTDLGISQSVLPTVPSLGQNATFTLTVTNNGPMAATGVQVTDLLPVGLTYVSDDGGGAYNSTSGTWTIGSLAVSASATLNIVATVGSTDTTCNLSQITAVTPLDTNASNNQATVCVMAPRVSDVNLTMSVSSPTVLVGNPVIYTLTVNNLGADTSYSLNVQDTFPAFPLLHATSLGASEGVYTASTGLWNISSLGNGKTATLVIAVNAPNTAGALTSNGVATSVTSDPNTVNNSASATTTVLSPASLTATKTVSGTFYPGGSITYTVILSNSSNFAQQDNPGNEFSDVLPNQLTLVSANATSGTAVATVGTNTVTWNGVVAGNGSVTITINATINNNVAEQTVTNQGTVNFDADGDGTNESTALTDDPGVSGTSDPTSFVVISPATLTATKTVSGNFTPGGTVTYTVVIDNSGPSTQLDNAGHEFTDVLPSGLTLTNATASSGTATMSGNTVNWDGSVGVGGANDVTITITATIASNAGGQTISNQGSVSYDADGDGSNESTALTNDPGQSGTGNPTSFTVLSPATISATKTVSGSFTPGGTVTYTIVISNSGSSAQLDNPGHEFTDTLPSGLTLTNAVATSGTPTTSGNTANWDGSIAAGGSVTITITAAVAANAAGQTITNQGTVNYDADGNGTNESSGVTNDPGVGGSGNPTSFVVTSSATLSATKTVAGTLHPGGTITYTVVISNAGPSPQLDNPGHEFVDVLPSDLVLTGVTATSGTAVMSGNTVNWDGSVGVGAGNSVTITITATINADTLGHTITNQGTVNYDADGNGTNEATALTDDPTKPGAADPTSFTIPAPAVAVPAGNALTMMLLAMLLGFAALLRWRKARGMRGLICTVD